MLRTFTVFEVLLEYMYTIFLKKNNRRFLVTNQIMIEHVLLIPI